MTVETQQSKEQVKDKVKAEAKQDTRAEETIEEVVAGNPLLEEDMDSMDKEEAGDEKTTKVHEEHKAKIATLTDELAKAKDQVLRAFAEMENIKRRARMDVEKAHKFGLEKMVKALLPIVDSLEKGIESAANTEGSNAQNEALKEGMTLTLKLFTDTLGQFDIKQLNPEGEPFDPNFHQAMSMVPNPDMEPNTVMTVFQKGYTLSDRIVRPAMVVVSKGV
ncbi:Protein GrpE [invertebrate metagenome]|uniref:Protein GrpE n=1 Tax=invertebrate metagenome TaxID=1711999 RepID=A0A2H9T6M2_9ZZZZ